MKFWSHIQCRKMQDTEKHFFKKGNTHNRFIIEIQGTSHFYCVQSDMLDE